MREQLSEFRKQHYSLLAFGGVLGLNKSKPLDKRIQHFTKLYKETNPNSGHIENLMFWLSVAYDEDTLTFEPFPYKTGTPGPFIEYPMITPLEFVELLDGEVNRDEALCLLDDLQEHMYLPAYNAFRRILSRDLTCYGLDKESAFKLMEALL